MVRLIELSRATNTRYSDIIKDPIRIPKDTSLHW